MFNSVGEGYCKKSLVKVNHFTDLLAEVKVEMYCGCVACTSKCAFTDELNPFKAIAVLHTSGQIYSS